MIPPYLLQSFDRSEKLARGTWLRRLLHNPFKYLHAIFYRRLWLPITKRPTLKTITTFFNRKMQVVFPSGTDIYLTGAKTDDAEIRLSRFLLSNISSSVYFIDIGAHFGYYSLLADTLGAKKVWAIEPSDCIFKVLQTNTAAYGNIIPVNVAFSDRECDIELSEFPHLYSEYSTAFPNQFINEKWFQSVPVTKTILKATTLDISFSNKTDGPVIIKIDAEGSEYNILYGARQFFGNNAGVTIVMEYVSGNRSGGMHDNAVALLSQLGFSCYCINTEGSLSVCGDVKQHMLYHNLETDNLVFIKE